MLSNQFNLTLISSDSLEKYPQNVLSSFINYLEEPLILTGHWEVGISEVFLGAFESKKSNVNTHENSTDFDFMLIYSNIIKARIVGDQNIKCLKVLAIEPEKKNYIKLARIEYYPVEVNEIRNISINILDRESQRISFHASSMPTLVTLHFQKIR